MNRLASPKQNEITGVKGTKMEFISVGPKCISTMNLRELKYRKAAYPFDWIFCTTSIVQHCIETNFAYFLDKTMIVSKSDTSSDHKYYNKHLDSKEDLVIFNHHNLGKNDVYAAYVRRCARFMQRYNDVSQPLCFVYTIQNEKSDAFFYDCKDWQDAQNFATFLRSEGKNHISLITFVLQYVANVDMVIPWHPINTNHSAFMVYYHQFDNLKDVLDILKSVEKNEHL